MPEPLRRSPFYELHREAGAKLIPFAGFEMPVHYRAGIVAEHRAVREGVGLFDVSHMGEFLVTGPGAVAFADHVTSNDVSALAAGQAQYSTILHEDGGIVDDCLVYRFADRIMLVVNAANIAKDFAHLSRFAPLFDVNLEDHSERTALLALQGPGAEAALRPLAPSLDLGAIGYYRFAEGEVAGLRCVVSRTGYTGEDGFELYFDAERAVPIWRALVGGGEGPGEGGAGGAAAQGAGTRVVPAGLGCRDSLRLEMGYPLYGNDIDDATTPLEAGLAWVVKLRKPDFVGRAALIRQKEQGVRRKLVGFRLEGRAFPRHGYPVYLDGEPVGEVRSGTVSPSLGVAIGLAYLPVERSAPGVGLEVDCRGSRFGATVVKLPFWDQGSHR